MTSTGAGADLVQAIRRRVRLRTRLRRARDTWRRWRPRRLPAWSDSEPSAKVNAAGDSTCLTVDTVGGLRRFAASTDPVRSLRLTVAHWRTPYPGWSGRVGPLPRLLQHEVSLPETGRGPATVALRLAEPVPLRQAVAAARVALTPSRPLPRPASGGRDGVVLASPRGRRQHGPHLPVGQLRVDQAQWRVTREDDGVTVVAGRPAQPLDERQAEVLAELGAVTFDFPAEGEAWHHGSAPAATTSAPAVAAQPAAAVLSQLALTGLVLSVPKLPDGLLAPALTELVRAPLPAPGADPMEWEIRSVAQRREALRHHAGAFTAPADHPGLARPPAVSALLVTRRPKMLARALAALAAQTYPELEVVVALHGIEVPDGLALPGPVVTVPAEWTLGEALGAATRAASGSLVTKVDDDDRYGPEHIWDLVLARYYSGAEVVGKGAEFVYLEPRDLTVRRRMTCEDYTDTVAGGTILLGRGDLEAVGGWPPVPRSVDRALLDRVLAEGGAIYRTHALGFIYTRHGDGHTWDPGMEYFLTDPARRWQGLPPYPEFGTA